MFDKKKKCRSASETETFEGSGRAQWEGLPPSVHGFPLTRVPTVHHKPMSVSTKERVTRARTRAGNVTRADRERKQRQTPPLPLPPPPRRRIDVGSIPDLSA